MAFLLDFVFFESAWFEDFLFRENRSGEDACTAYVSFKDAYSQETACLLSVSILIPNKLQAYNTVFD